MLSPLALASVGWQLDLSALPGNGRGIAIGLSWKLVLAPAMVLGLLNAVESPLPGWGLNADWSIARKALATARALGAHVAGSYGSALQLTLIVKRDQVKALTKALHEALIG